MLQIGSVLDGKYKILQEIGHGGMSVVYLALNERANKTWAVKEVRKDGGNDKTVVSQGLVAETEMLKKLSHPNLPSIIDVIDKDDSFIIVMDYIEGGSLQKRLEKMGPQNADDVVRWALQLADVLGYLHSRKPPIIYRDMKPSNVMLKPDGNVCLIDFGTAREYKQTSSGDTTWLGTRGYAAPEQFGGHGQTDARTDIYNLGATMYHLLTGYSPADTQFIIYPISRFRPELAGTGIEKIVAKCCQPDPKDRYQSCAELTYALEHVHDEDDTVRKSRNRKWYSFLASCSVTVIGAALAIMFSIFKTNAINTSYDTYISQAESSGFDRAVESYRSAMELQPENEEAYMGLLNLCASDYTITNEEREAIESCINSTRSSNAGTRSNLEILKQRNPEGYDQFEYQLGTSYFVGYSGGKREAYNCLANVIESENLTNNERTVANTYYLLADYYVQLGDTAAQATDDKDDGFGWAKTNVSYNQLWENLYAVVEDSETVSQKAGGGDYAAAMYRETANQIASNIAHFRSDGVAMNEIRNAIDEGRAYISNLQETNTNGSLIEQTNQALDSAERTYESYMNISANSVS